MAELIVYMPDHISGDRDPADVRGEIIGNLVRCKDCKYFDDTIYACLCGGKMYGLPTNPKWFCANGERNDTK